MWKSRNSDSRETNNETGILSTIWLFQTWRVIANSKINTHDINRLIEGKFYFMQDSLTII